MTRRAAELRALLELMLLPGLGDIRLRRLLRRYRSPDEALAALRADWRGALGMKPRRPDVDGAVVPDFGEGLSQREPPVASWARDEPRKRAIRLGRVERSARLIEAAGIAVLLERQRRYPKRLRRLHDPPPVLFAVGDLRLLRRPAIAVVGSRMCTEYGRSAAELFASELARAGMVVVSGLARGIDGIAHEAALDAGGGTIAVLGCGIDVVYPPEHQHLQERIAREGLLLSEFPPGEPPAPHNFPKRNRVLAALPLATLVVEAGHKSGAIITANQAVELGREVFAVPGPIGRETSAGANELIRDGGHIATAPRDILERLEPQVRRIEAAEAARAPRTIRESSAASRQLAAHPAPRGAMRQTLWAALESDTLHVDQLAAHARSSATRVLVALLEMELEGYVRQLPGMRFERARRA